MSKRSVLPNRSALDMVWQLVPPFYVYTASDLWVGNCPDIETAQMIVTEHNRNVLPPRAPKERTMRELTGWEEEHAAIHLCNARHRDDDAAYAPCPTCRDDVARLVDGGAPAPLCNCPTRRDYGHESYCPASRRTAGPPASGEDDDGGWAISPNASDSLWDSDPTEPTP